MMSADDVELVLIDGPVSPIQQRNLEKQWGVKVLDRTGLILEIFGERARTREGVLQVDLANLEYQKTRLVRSWTHLERQRGTGGGVGGTVGGSGESQLESDRRAIDDAINVMAEDMLFATLDPTMREVELPEGQKIILSDTVGFISELPTQLVAAFKATLEEVLDADLILHIRDISHPESQAQCDDVLDILTKLGITERAQEHMIEVWNKIDLLPDENRETALNRAERAEAILAVSATTGEGMDALLKGIEDALEDPMNTEVVRLAYAEGKRRAWLFKQNVVDSEEQDELGFLVTVTWTTKLAAQFAKYG